MFISIEIKIKFWNFSFSIRIPSYFSISKTIYIEIWRSRDRHDVILLFGFLDVNLMLFWNENFNLSLLSVSSELASSEIKMR